MPRRISKSSNTHSQLSEVETLLSTQPDIEFAYLFGSQATGRVTPMSDIDIAVYLTAPYAPLRQIELLGKLNDLLKTDDIDLVILNTAPISLRMRVIKPRQVICDNQPHQRHIFESLTMREYFDFQKFERQILDKRFFNGRSDTSA